MGKYGKIIVETRYGHSIRIRKSNTVLYLVRVRQFDATEVYERMRSTREIALKHEQEFLRVKVYVIFGLSSPRPSRNGQ